MATYTVRKAPARSAGKSIRRLLIQSRFLWTLMLEQATRLERGSSKVSERSVWPFRIVGKPGL